jgi:hypothetical protein
LRQHHAVLTRAAEAVRARHPEMSVEIKLMELDGSVRILPCAACAPAPGLRAEAVEDPAGGLVARAARGAAAGGAWIAPPRPAPAEPDPAGFAELVKLRAQRGLPDAEAELALLTEGVTRYGLGAAEARAALEAEGRRRGVAGSGGAAEARTFLRSAADARGRVGRADVSRAAALYRSLTGRHASQGEAERRVAALLEAEGLSPRPDGLLRSTAWFRRMARA